MGFKCDIVGLPNARKSTLLNALAKAGIKAANFPFCTIEPNTGVVSMPNPCLGRLTKIVRPQRTFPITMRFVGIAGLIKGASKSEGLSNRFLINTHKTETIDHVVRCFENDNVIHVSGRVSPADDIEVANTELAPADPDAYERAIHRVQKKTRGGDKDAKAELAILERCLPQLENTGMLRALDLSVEEKVAVRYLDFLTPKPIIYIVNVNEDGFENDPYLDQVREITTKEGSVTIPVCTAVEAGITELDDEGRDEFMQELGLEEPGLNRVTRVGHKLLDLQTYFTAGVKGIRTWTIPVGATVPQVVGKAHTDFKRGFIRTQTVSFEDFITYKGKQGAEEAGEMRAEGKDCIVKDGDVMGFLFNV